MTRWYVVQTHPRAERQAEWHLRNQGFETYLPRFLKKRRHARQVSEVATPLFPGYLFLRMDLAVTRWRAIRSTVGVAGLVAAGDTPTPVPRGIVEQIQSRQDTRGLVRLPPPALDRGARVEITEGAFDGLTALVEGMSDRERVVLLLDLLGRAVRVRLPLEMVRAVA